MTVLKVALVLIFWLVAQATMFLKAALVRMTFRAGRGQIQLTTLCLNLQFRFL